MIETVLIDMDSIMVDMIQSWLDMYALKTGEHHNAEKANFEYNVENLVSKPDVLRALLREEGFFENLPPMEGVQEYFPKVAQEFETLVVTQLPHDSDYAARDKYRWIKKYFPKYDTRRIIFASKKEFVVGDVFFDDKPMHLDKQRARNPDTILATITYPYNRAVPVDWRFEKETAWKEFYQTLKNHNEFSDFVF